MVFEPSRDRNLIASMLDGHSRDGIRKMDVIALWEHLRRILTFELSSKDTVRQAGAMIKVEDVHTHSGFSESQ